jgi:hypothetical protein
VWRYHFAMPSAMTRDQWIAAFAAALSQARPEYGAKHARRVGQYEWASRRRVLAPAEAAKQWAAEQDERRRKPAKG